MSARVPQKELVRAASGLMDVRPGPGLRMAARHLIGLNALLWLTFQMDSWPAFLAMAFVTGTCYASAMMTTHDAIHHTLTGWPVFDEVMPRLLSWFVFWPHGLYGELHKLHHKLNGRDLADPENPTCTLEAYKRKGPLGRWLARNEPWLAVFVYGGAGMIVKHVHVGLQWWPKHAGVRRALKIDLAGIAVATAITLSVIVYAGVTWRYFAYLLVVERIIGFSHQLRSHLEHYGLWGQAGESLMETRLHACRNIATWPVVSRFFNGLNYHSVHHAFPRVPFYRLAEAHARIAALCAAHGRPLPQSEGYVRTLRRLAQGDTERWLLDAVPADAAALDAAS